MSKKVIFLLFLIIAIASVLRLWQLGNVPASPDWDEVSLGYNAYSIMNTGRDEFGKVLPLVLRSFNDYKPALYAYLAIPSVALFNLTVFAVRLPSAILGILSVVATFFLVKELFRGKYSDTIALLSSFLLAISPWHIQFSRVAFEAQAGLSFNIFSVLFFIKGLKKPIFLFLSVLFASFSIYTYQSEKVYVPILFVALFFVYRKEIFNLPRKWIFSVIIFGFIFLSPFFYSTFSSQDILMRAKGVSAFSPSKTESVKRVAQNYAFDKSQKNYLGMFFDNKLFEYAKVGFSGYISHFDPNWLFITGDIERHHAPNMGLLYIIELPFILIGIYKLIFSKFWRKGVFTIFAIFLIAPIPAAVTIDVPHAVRTINFLPTFQIFTAVGLLSFFSFARSKFKLLGTLCIAVLIVLFALNIAYYLDQYFVQQNYYYSKYWQYGYKQAISETQKIKNSYNEVVISDKVPMDQSYIFFLFYLKYNPSLYQKEVNSLSSEFSHKFDKYEFRNINWNKDSKSSNVLYIGSPSDFPLDVKVLKTIYNLDGTIAIEIVST